MTLSDQCRALTQSHATLGAELAELKVKEQHWKNLCSRLRSELSSYLHLWQERCTRVIEVVSPDYTEPVEQPSSGKSSYVPSVEQQFVTVMRSALSLSLQTGSTSPPSDVMDHKLPDTALAGYVSGEVSAVFAQLFDTIYGQRADDAAPAQPAGKLGSTRDGVEDTKHGSPSQTSLAESPTGVPNRVSAGMLLRTGARLDAQARELRKLKSELHRLVTPPSDADVKSLSLIHI